MRMLRNSHYVYFVSITDPTVPSRTEMARYLICGSRDYCDLELMEATLAKLPPPEVVITGMARGADEAGRLWASKHWKDAKHLGFPAEWGKYGRAAGPIRNQKMLEEGKPTLVIAFPKDGKSISSGTKSMITLSEKAKVPVLIAASE